MNCHAPIAFEWRGKKHWRFRRIVVEDFKSDQPRSDGELQVDVVNFAGGVPNPLANEGGDVDDSVPAALSSCSLLLRRAVFSVLTSLFLDDMIVTFFAAEKVTMRAQRIGRLGMVRRLRRCNKPGSPRSKLCLSQRLGSKQLRRARRSKWHSTHATILYCSRAATKCCVASKVAWLVNAGSWEKSSQPSITTERF